MITVFTGDGPDFITIADTQGDAYQDGPGRSRQSPVVILDRARAADLALPYYLLLADHSYDDGADQLIDPHRSGFRPEDPDVGQVMDIVETGHDYALVSGNIHVDLIVTTAELVAIFRAAGVT